MKEIDKELMREFFELAVKIFKSRQKTRPDDIRNYVESGHKDLYLSHEDFFARIQLRQDYAAVDAYILDIVYSVHAEICIVWFFRISDNEVIVEGQDSYGNDINELSIDQMVIIHKGIIDLARIEGIEFESEINYQILESSKSSISEVNYFHF